MRTQKEIIEKIKEWQRKDLLGFKISELLPYLSFENAKEFLKPDCTEKDWGKVIQPSRRNIKNKMIKYMPFAWRKANDCRGISAGRSMSHYVAWFWLLGDKEYDEFKDIENYEYYGKNELAEICYFLGLDSDKWDDKIRSNTEY